jgi:hypothetical protein
MRANLYEVSKWPSQKFQPVAWDGHDTAHPNERTTDGEGNAEFLALRSKRSQIPKRLSFSLLQAQWV